MLSINTYLFIFVSCVCISACSEEEHAESSPDTVEVTPGTDTEIQPEHDAAKTSDILAPEDGLDSDTLCSDPCAEGDWCTPDGECVECVENIHCDYPMWCSDGQCIETLCLPGLVACDEEVPVAAQLLESLRLRGVTPDGMSDDGVMPMASK